jgi:hypothetical protein
VTSVAGTVTVGPVPLRSPASGALCAHWRLRVFEIVAPGMELVHEAASSDFVDIVWRERPDDDLRVVRVPPDSARIVALPALHREGTPGALAVATYLGLHGRVRVEEVLLKHGEDVEAEGVLLDPGAALSRGPLRAVDMPPELVEATVRVVGSTLGPVLLPWALGTAAAVLGAVGTAAAVASLARRVLPPMRGTSPAAQIGVPSPPHPRWP